MTTSSSFVPVSALRGLSTVDAERLRNKGIANTSTLLMRASDPRAERKLAQATGVAPDVLRRAVNTAELIQIPGIGPALADLFEHAGVNGIDELAHRAPAHLAPVLSRTAAADPSLLQRTPGVGWTAHLVEASKVFQRVTTSADALPILKDFMSRYVDEVLLSDHPEGRAWRSAVLDSQAATPAERTALMARFRREFNATIPAFLGQQTGNVHSHQETMEDRGDNFLFDGRWQGLHTEAVISKRDGNVSWFLLEVD